MRSITLGVMSHEETQDNEHINTYTYIYTYLNSIFDSCDNNCWYRYISRRQVNRPNSFFRHILLNDYMGKKTAELQKYAK